MIYDSHVHSKLSSDSTLEFIDAIQGVIVRNLKGLAFTDHLDLDFPGYEKDFHIDPKTYFDKILFIKENNKNKVDVITAIEIGIQPHVLDETMFLIKDQPYDFILGSTHIVDKCDPYLPVFYKNKSKQATYLSYLDQINKNIRLFENFDVLSHYDYIVRYSPYEDPTMNYVDFSDIFDEIFKYLISSGKGLEINTANYLERSSLSRPYAKFDTNVLVRYKELGGEIITLGSDAHKKDVIGKGFTHYMDVIKNCGFNYIANYKQRKPEFTKI